MPNPVETELDSLIAILESQIPANINRKENTKLEKELRADLEKYVKALEQVFPYEEATRLYYKYVKSEG